MLALTEVTVTRYESLVVLVNMVTTLTCGDPYARMDILSSPGRVCHLLNSSLTGEWVYVRMRVLIHVFSSWKNHESSSYNVLQFHQFLTLCHSLWIANVV